jgi:hypothetical protein
MLLVLFVRNVIGSVLQGCSVGSEGCACSPNNNCDFPLTCFSNVCACIIGAPGCLCHGTTPQCASGAACGVSGTCPRPVLPKVSQPPVSFFFQAPAGLDNFIWIIIGVVAFLLLVVICIVIAVCKFRSSDHKYAEYVASTHAPAAPYAPTTTSYPPLSFDAGSQATIVPPPIPAQYGQPDLLPPTFGFGRAVRWW